MKEKPVFILGHGGHAKVLFNMLLRLNGVSCLLEKQRLLKINS